MIERFFLDLDFEHAVYLVCTILAIAAWIVVAVRLGADLLASPAVLRTRYGLQLIDRHAHPAAFWGNAVLRVLLMAATGYFCIALLLKLTQRG